MTLPLATNSNNEKNEKQEMKKMEEYFNDKKMQETLLKACGSGWETTEENEISFIRVQSLMENSNIPIPEVFRSPMQDRYFIYYGDRETNLFTVYLPDFTVYAKNLTEDGVRTIVKEFEDVYPGFIPTPAGLPPSDMLVDIFAKKNRNSSFMQSWDCAELTQANLTYHNYAESLLARFSFHENAEKFERGEIDENEFVGYAESLIRHVPKAVPRRKRKSGVVVRIELDFFSYRLDYDMESEKAFAELPLFKTVDLVENEEPIRILHGEGETFNEAMISLARLVNESYDICWNAV